MKRSFQKKIKELQTRWAYFLVCCGAKVVVFDEFIGGKFPVLEISNGKYEGLKIIIAPRMTKRESDTWKRVIFTIEEQVIIKRPSLFVGEWPQGNTIDDIIHDIGTRFYKNSRNHPNSHLLEEFNYQTINGDYFGCHLGVNTDGEFDLFGDDNTYLAYMDKKATEQVYKHVKELFGDDGNE